MATTGEPLSDARLAEIRAFLQRQANSNYALYPDGMFTTVAMSELADEVERRGERYDALLSLSNAALDNSKRHEAEMHTALMRILDDADTFGWTSDAVSAARRRFSAVVE